MSSSNGLFHANYSVSPIVNRFRSVIITKFVQWKGMRHVSGVGRCVADSEAARRRGRNSFHQQRTTYRFCFSFEDWKAKLRTVTVHLFRSVLGPNFVDWKKQRHAGLTFEDRNNLE